MPYSLLVGPHDSQAPPCALLALLAAGGTSMPGFASKKLAGFKWNPVVSTGITGLHMHQQFARGGLTYSPCMCMGRVSPPSASHRSLSCNSNATHTCMRTQSSRRGTWVTPKECHTTTSLFLMLRSCTDSTKISTFLDMALERNNPYQYLACSTWSGAGGHGLARDTEDGQWCSPSWSSWRCCWYRPP